jgi:hypothetical protein
MQLPLDIRIKKAVMSFSHFTQKFDVLKKDGLFNDFLGRNAAGLFKKNFPIYDCFVPIVFEDDQIGMLLFQVKNCLSRVKNGVKAVSLKKFYFIQFFQFQTLRLVIYIKTSKWI